MRLTLIRSESIELTVRITHLTLFHLCLLSLVRLTGYIVNLWNFYSYRIIGKLTVFLKSQEFRLCILPVESSTSWHLTSKVGSTLVKAVSLRVDLDLDGALVTSRTHTHPSHSPHNPVYVRRVDSSSFVFSLSSDRHSFIGLVFNSRFIDSESELLKLQKVVSFPMSL
jgi:hypothetical protein